MQDGIPMWHNDHFHYEEENDNNLNHQEDLFYHQHYPPEAWHDEYGEFEESPWREDEYQENQDHESGDREYNDWWTRQEDPPRESEWNHDDWSGVH